MELQQFFIDGFGSHDLADALQELGYGDDVFEEDATKATLAGLLAGIDMPLPEVLDRFYPLALSNACIKFGLPGDTKAEYIAALAELDGQVQYTVKGRYVREVVLREIVDGDPEIAELNAQVRDRPDEEVYQERVRLGELVVNELDARRQAEGSQLHERLAALATAAVARSSSDPEEALNSAFLIPRQRTAEFEDAVEKVAAETGERVKFTLGGPLAPYDFAGTRE